MRVEPEPRARCCCWGQLTPWGAGLDAWDTELLVVRSRWTREDDGLRVMFRAEMTPISVEGINPPHAAEHDGIKGLGCKRADSGVNPKTSYLTRIS